MKKQNSSAIIAGVDEAGRGALAGPVVAAACILGTAKLHPLVKDSKSLSPAKREEVFAWIIQHCAFGIGIQEQSVVDAEGILAANEKAMQMAVSKLAEKNTPTYLLIDGRDKFWFDYPHSSIIRGDEKEPCISAASIIAKVTRDKLMVQYAKEFPEYHFELHKGYGTEKHIYAIKKSGSCALHRQSFLKNIS